MLRVADRRLWPHGRRDTYFTQPMGRPARVPADRVDREGHRPAPGLLSGGELPGNDLVALRGQAQPLVSKDLRVLREVGLVDVRGQGRQRMYRLNPGPLKPIHDWVKKYEQARSERDRMDAVLAELKEA